MASTKDSLQHCYDRLIAKIEDFLDDIAGLEASAAVVARTSTWLENLLAALDSWGVDIRLSNGALTLIENAPEGLKVRSILLDIDHGLSSPEDIISCFLPEQHSHESPQNEPDLNETTNVRSILRALTDLLDLVKPIRLLLANAHSTGPYKVLKSRIDEISAEHQRSSSHLLEGPWQIGTDPAETLGATNPIDDQPETKVDEVVRHMEGLGKPGASLPSFRSYNAGGISATLPSGRWERSLSRQRQSFRAAEVQKQVSADDDGEHEQIGAPHQKYKVERAAHHTKYTLRQSSQFSFGSIDDADSSQMRAGNTEASGRAGSDNDPQKEGPIIPPSPYLSDQVQELIYNWSTKRMNWIGTFAQHRELLELDECLFLLEAVRCESSSLLQYRQTCIRIYLLVRQYNTLSQLQVDQLLRDLPLEDLRNVEIGKTEELEALIRQMGRSELQFADDWSATDVTPPLRSPLLSQDHREDIDTPPKRMKVIDDPSLRSEVIEKPRLDMGFQTKRSDFFSVGRVFIMIWHEGDTRAAKPSREPNSSNAEEIFSGIRRFAVVRECHGFSWAVPVNTYHGQGLCKPGFRKEDWDAHAIIYTGGTPPIPRSNEPHMIKKPIAVQTSSEGKRLDQSSRIRFDKVFSIGHNVKVQNIGKVTASSMPWFLHHWRDEALKAVADLTPTLSTLST
ncbi:hypothetical protein PV04_08675 [Phialophora macrospora]|uniref:DUF6590 domain-containing protein n=1 Tax=Phialophora macrospora TaxID=1851006 RepID=A0A0D2DMZ4_9EURO|nr:hypothetical protein PV04_08675 [Phialophora macrospora]